MWHCPINGSQINRPARLYKRFTPTQTVTLADKEILVENNYYRAYCCIPWVEVSEKDLKAEQYIDGGTAKTSDLTIKYNGTYELKEGSKDEPEPQDILFLSGKWWMIQSIVKRKRIKSMINFAVVYLSLIKINREEIYGG